MYKNEIETKTLGRMKVLACIEDIALIERLCDTPEKYVVGVGFNKETDSWSYGIYHNKLNKALYVLENAKDRYNISEGYDQFLKYAIGLDDKEIESYNNFAWKLDREYSSPEDFIKAELKNNKAKSEEEVENIDIELSKFAIDDNMEME